MRYYMDGKKISEREYELFKKTHPDMKEVYDTGCDCYGNEYSYIDVKLERKC